MTHSFPKYIQLFLFCFLFLSLKYTIVYVCPSSGKKCTVIFISFSFSLVEVHGHALFTCVFLAIF